MKKKSLSRIKKELWKLTSDFVRKRDCGICFTCGRFAEGSAYHAGHYIPASIGGIELKYDERNIHGQCYHCNINLGGYGVMYHRRMLEIYGKELVEELWRIKNLKSHWLTKDYLKKVEYYKNLL